MAEAMARLWGPYPTTRSLEDDHLDAFLKLANATTQRRLPK
jgi:hypothetical protein